MLVVRRNTIFIIVISELLALSKTNISFPLGFYSNKSRWCVHRRRNMYSAKSKCVWGRNMYSARSKCVWFFADKGFLSTDVIHYQGRSVHECKACSACLTFSRQNM